MKLKNIQKGAGIALAALLLSVALSTSAKAVVLGPNSPTVPINTSTFGGGASVFQQNITALTPGGVIPITGTYAQSVYRVADVFYAGSQSLDFYYRFTITGGSAEDAAAVTFSNLLYSYYTDVTYLTSADMALAFGTTNDDIFSGGTFETPTTVRRLDIPGTSSIQLNYTNPVNNGETTLVFRVRTDANQIIDLGSLAVQGIGQASGRTVSPDGPPVPEPTAALFGCALVGTVFFSRRRKVA